MNVPWILDVPEFEAVEIHPGNFPGDTKACLLVGMERFTDRVGITRSRDAWELMFQRIMAALLRHEEVWITYVNQFIVPVTTGPKTEA